MATRRSIREAAPSSNGKMPGPEFARRLIAWFENHGRDLPWRKTSDPYAILVSELMLQQTQVVTALPYFARWMARFPTIESLAAAEVAEVLRLWQGLGYYARARHLHAAAKTVVKEGGILPATADALRRLPGVGEYTAGAVASFAFGEPVPAVDGNVARVLARLFDLRLPVDSAPGRRQLLTLARAMIPDGMARTFNGAIMELGALICVAGSPRCEACPVRRWCRADRPIDLPLKRARPTVKHRVERRWWIERRGRLFLQQETGPVWNGLWRLPADPSDADVPPLAEVRYGITRYRVTMEIRRGPTRGTGEGRWFPTAELGEIPMPSPHRRAVRALL